MSVEWTPGQFLLLVKEGGFQGAIIGIGIVEDRWVRKITGGPRTGHVYRRRGIEHQASAPGEPPASDTGRLVNSRRIEYHVGEQRASMVVAAEYAMPLELGTRKMDPRPHLRITLAESRDEITAAIATEISKRIRV